MVLACLAFLATVVNAASLSGRSSLASNRDRSPGNSTGTIELPPSYFPPTVFRGPGDPETFKINTASAAIANLEYYGGPIIRNVVVQPIFYGNINYASEITAFYKGVTQSPWMDLLAQYGIGAGSSLPPISVSTTMDYSKGYLSDQDIQAYLKNLVKTGAILPTVSMYFPIHFQSGIKIQSGFDSSNNPEFSCQNFCGYHGAIDVSSPTNILGLDFNANTQTQFLYYGVLPDFTDPSCPCHAYPNNGFLADTLSVAAHELAEAATDGLPDRYFLGWYDFNISPGGEEVADICAWRLGKTVSRVDGQSYDVQLIWSNNDVSCDAEGSTAPANPAIGTGCYPAFNQTQVYLVGDVASRADPNNPAITYNIKLDGSRNWIQGDSCNPKLNVACYPKYQCDQIPLIDGTQVWCGSLNYIVNNGAFAFMGYCVVYPHASVIATTTSTTTGTSSTLTSKPTSSTTSTSTSSTTKTISTTSSSTTTSTTTTTTTTTSLAPTPTQLVGVGTDNTLWYKASLSTQWTQLSNFKILDLIQLPNLSFVAAGTDNNLYTCPTLDTCTQVPGSGSVKSIDILADKNTYIGVGMDNQLYTRSGIYGAWALVPGSGNVVDVTVLTSGVLVGTTPQNTLVWRQTLGSPWVNIANSCCVSRTAALLDGSFVGVGGDFALYRKATLDAQWVFLPGTGNVVSVVQISAMPVPKIMLVGVGMDNSLWGKYSLAGPWSQISGPKSLDLIQLPDASFVTVGLDNLLYKCPTLATCTQVVGSGSVKSIDLLSDKSTFVGVGMDGQLYTRFGITGGWNLVPNSGTVIDITVLDSGALVGTGPDWNMYIRATLTSQWTKVEGSCCVSRTAQLPDGSILGIGGDNAIYQKQSLQSSSPWVVVPNSKSVLSIATTR